MIIIVYDVGKGIKKLETNTERRARLRAKEKQLEENYMSKLCDLEARRIALEIRRLHNGKKYI